MKRIQLHVFSLFAMCLFFNCTQTKTVEQDSVEQEPDNKGRNMFGHYIQRGLTIKDDNLTPGYVMFTPSNSASVYLLNRNGEVVHEWKGNYGTHSPYLNNDGSITLMASDPDFPVFAGGGQMGRLQKISWKSKMLWDFEYAAEDIDIIFPL